MSVNSKSNRVAVWHPNSAAILERLLQITKFILEPLYGL